MTEISGAGDDGHYDENTYLRENTAPETLRFSLGMSDRECFHYVSGY